MKFLSEITKKAYDTQEECVAAEKEFQEKVLKKTEEEKLKKEQRAKRAKEVEEAYKAVIEANKVFNEKRNAFIKDYGSYHMTYSNTQDTINDIFETVFKFF